MMNGNADDGDMEAVGPLPTSKGAQVSISRENISFLREVLAKEADQQQPDVDIWCREDAVSSKWTAVPCSAVLLAISSQYLESVLDDYLKRSLRVDDERLVILLPGFHPSAVEGMLVCLKTGSFQCQTKEEFAQLQALFDLLRINVGEQASCRRKKPKPEQKEDAKEYSSANEFLDGDFVQPTSGLSIESVIKTEQDEFGFSGDFNREVTMKNGGRKM